MRITVLAENYASARGITGEHGLSLFVETGKQKILFDMGQGGCFLGNAEKLGVKISDVDTAVISHGHYDHGGGALKFLKENEKANIYISKTAFGKYYSKNGYIGLDSRLQDEKRVILADEEIKLSDNVFLFPAKDVPRNEKNYSSLLEKEANGIRCEDDFSHEQYMLIEENGKKVLFSGCSHRGILNIMERFSPHVFVGGLHLSSLDADSEELKQVAEKLLKYETVYYTCHCTGIEQYSTLKRLMGNRIDYINCGKNIVI